MIPQKIQVWFFLGLTHVTASRLRTDGHGSVRASGITRALTGSTFQGFGDTFKTQGFGSFRNGHVNIGKKRHST